MVYEVHTASELFHAVDIAAISLLEFNSLGKVGEIATDEIVATDHVVAAGNKCIGEMTAEKSRHT